jgi:predicted nucleic acid-binding protein
MVACVDSPVVLSHVLVGDVSIRHALEFPAIMSSELVEIECRSVLLRCRLQDELTDETLVEAGQRLDDVLGGIDLLELSPAIKRRAMESFPVSVKTLDALHLATALAIGSTGDGDKVVLFSARPRSGWRPRCTPRAARRRPRRPSQRVGARTASPPG